MELAAIRMRNAWGKINRATDGFHPLAHHCMDVAAVFERLVQLPVIRDRLDQAAGTRISDVLRDRLAVLVFLHDIGKLHPGFQAKGWPQGSWRGPLRGHVEEGWGFLLLAARWSEHPFHETMQRIMQWGEAVSPLAAAVLAHHGRPVTPPGNPIIAAWDKPSSPEYDWRAEARNVGNILPQWFDGAFCGSAEAIPNLPRFHHEVAGLTALADWVGSDTRSFEYMAPFDAAYDRIAHRRAAKAVEVLRLDTSVLSVRPPPDFAKLSGFPRPNPAQAVVGAIETDARLVILEAETGSGKTEAALWRFTQLLSAGKVSGLYFAVPTRSAARQLHRRIVETMGRVFGNDAPEPVLAIPGMLRAGEFDGHRLPGWEVRWDDDRAGVSERWAAEQANRFLAATVAVGTVDQAMLAGLKVKHAHARGSALARSLLVVDEVHASDSYMTEVLVRLLDGHLAVGGYAMLMSATLGARARVRWTEATLPDFAKASTVPYPAIWTKGDPEPRTAVGIGRSKTVTLRTMATMDPAGAAQRAICSAERGARVLVVRNTVAAAVATWRAVRNLGAGHLLMQVEGGPALHHSRFAAEDRILLDRSVESVLGPARDREPQGCIVVGTQTLEQSLDIDADLLISDLCPIDVLLQRIGRLHRHAEVQRSAGFDSAHLDVLLPEAGLDHLTAPAFENGLGAWETPQGIHGVYRDLAGLELTRRLILECGRWTIPEMNRALVEGATHPERIAALIAEKGEAWDRYERNVGGASLAQAMIAGLNALDRTDRFDTMIFPGDDERIVTRLGESGAVLTLDPPVVGPFGCCITRIAVPARWSYGFGDDSAVAVEADYQGLVLTAGEWRFRYSREGLHLMA